MNRKTFSGSIHFPRGRRTGPAVATAILILIAAAATGYAAILKGSRRQVPGVALREVVQSLTGTAWNSPVVLIVGSVAAAVGLLLLMIAVVPAPQPLVELNGSHARTAAALNVRSLRRAVQSAALRIDGIVTARAHVGRRRIRLNLSTWLRHTNGLGQCAQDAATERLTALDLVRPRAVQARLEQKDR